MLTDRGDGWISVTPNDTTGQFHVVYGIDGREDTVTDCPIEMLGAVAGNLLQAVKEFRSGENT